MAVWVGLFVLAMFSVVWFSLCHSLLVCLCVCRVQCLVTRGRWLLEAPVSWSTLISRLCWTVCVLPSFLTWIGNPASVLMYPVLLHFYYTSLSVCCWLWWSRGICHLSEVLYSQYHKLYYCMALLLLFFLFSVAKQVTISSATEVCFLRCIFLNSVYEISLTPWVYSNITCVLYMYSAATSLQYRVGRSLPIPHWWCPVFNSKMLSTRAGWINLVARVSSPRTGEGDGLCLKRASSTITRPHL